jgi:DNA-binding MarR family transcriptional regulator
MSEEPDLDRIKRLLADVARSVGIPANDDAMLRHSESSWPAQPSEAVRTATTMPIDERLSTALAWLSARDERDRVFGSDLFFDPAWNMLLDLYVNERRGAVVSVSSLCIAARVPSTTALRWLTMLEKRNLIGRRADDYDRRRSFLFLTEDGRSKVEATLDRAAERSTKLGVPFLNRLN